MPKVLLGDIDSAIERWSLDVVRLEWLDALPSRLVEFLTSRALGLFVVLWRFLAGLIALLRFQKILKSLFLGLPT